MKIAAIRLADAGRFDEPVAVEGFSGVLDVLAAPNEHGKSTILRALRAVLLEKHTSTGGPRTMLGALRPYLGGDPLIEVDLDMGERVLRLRKQFGRGRSARLVDVRTGAILAGNAEAEQHVAALLSGRGPGNDSLGLLWVGQRHAFDVLKPDSEALGPVQSAIEQEIAAVASGPTIARQIRAEIRSQLAPLITESQQRPKAGGEYDRALKRRDTLRAQRDLAAQRAAAVEAQLDELAALENRLVQWSEPTAKSALEDALARADERLQRANDAVSAQAAAREALQVAEQNRSTAERGFAQLQSAIEKLRELDAALQSSQVRGDELAQVAQERAATTQVIAARLSERRTEFKSVQDTLAKANAVMRQRAQMERLRELAGRLAQAQALAARLKHVEVALSVDRASAGALAAIEREVDSIGQLRERIAATSALLRFTYVPGARAHFEIGGEKISEGTELRVDGPLQVEVPGIGTIFLAPGGGSDVEEDRRSLSEAEAELARLLVQSGAHDVDDARRLGAAREANVRVRESLRAQMGALAPSGLDELAREHDLVARSLGPQIMDASVDSSPEGLERLAARSEDLERELAGLDRQLADARAKLDAATAERATLCGRIEGLERQKADIACDLPAADQRGEVLRRLMLEVEEARAAVGRAGLVAQEADRNAPSREDLRALSVARDVARRALSGQVEERHQVEQRIERLRGALEEAIESGAALRVTRLDGELVEAEQDVERLERNVRSLLLLAEALDAAAHDASDSYLAPVVARLAPYLGMVFPDATVSFDGALKVTSLERRGTAERLDGLSDGTQEQIAVLVRLAFARLLADAGHPTPVVLDDALVYSDDARIERMFGALDAASRKHQVIVFTCRERTFERLGGNRLRIMPWKPE